MPSPVSLPSDSSSSGSSSAEQEPDPVQTTTMCSASSTTPLEPLHQLQLLLREKCGFNSQWPHAGSRTLALIGCTLGVFNMCRFAVLTINFGGNFLLQFLLLSVIFGIPLLWLRSAFCGSQEMQQAPLSTPIKQAAETDEALCVLSELDAILDVHDVSQLNGTCSSSSMNSGSDDDKVEDYLMDLDNYLEEMDNALCREESLIIMGGHSSLKREPRTRTLPLSRKKKSNKKKCEEQEPGQGDFEREHQMRKTFSCSLRPTSQTGWNSL